MIPIIEGMFLTNDEAHGVCDYGNHGDEDQESASGAPPRPYFACGVAGQVPVHDGANDHPEEPPKSHHSAKRVVSIASEAEANGGWY
jgi:hypothetical protein